MSYSVLLPSEEGEGPSLDRSFEILMASSMADSRPSPPSPRRAGPKHSGRRMSSLTTTLAFSSTLSPGQTRRDTIRATFCKPSALKTRKQYYHCRRRRIEGSLDNVHPPQGSSQCQGILCSPASHNSADHNQPSTAPPEDKRRRKNFIKALLTYIWSL